MPALEEGQKFQRYRVVRRLGSGLSGISYEAEDTKQLRKVTLKLIHPWSVLPDAARRQFFRDMQGISVLTHPYLATTLDYGEVEGQLYIVRSYIESGSLLGNEGRQWFQPPLPIKTVLTYISQLAQALAVIHNAGYVHGALTFSNILVLCGPNTGYTNEVVANFAPFLLTDSGIAHFVRCFGQPQNNFLPITAAPEQFQKHLTPASDQYALAVLLYFWLAGRPPFIGTPEEVEQKKRSETFGLLNTLNPDFTLAQEGILRRALSADPYDRYACVPAFAQALQLSFKRAEPQATTRAVSIAFTQVSPQPAQPVPSQPIQLTPQPAPDVPQPPPDPQPDVPQPGIEPSMPQPLPEPEVQPAEPSAPEPKPEIIPPAPDIAQPIPDPTPFPELQLTPEPKKTYMLQRQTEPLQKSQYKTLEKPAHLSITSVYMKSPRIIPLEHTTITLGRAGDSDILLDEDILTSRHHALLQREEEHYVIYDQRSTYGVSVNGQKLPNTQGHWLIEGDIVTIGEYQLTFHMPISQRILDATAEQILF